jgi:hypothetical protein
LAHLHSKRGKSPKAIATAMGHLDQQQQNLRLTKPENDTTKPTTQRPSKQITAYKCILQQIPAHFKPSTHMMDNEASKGLKDFLVKDNNMQYQLVPPHIHRRNAAERAIRTFKTHFIAGLC